MLVIKKGDEYRDTHLIVFCEVQDNLKESPGKVEKAGLCI